MLTFVAAVLVLLWLVFFIGFHVVGGLIHILLVLAVILFLIRVIMGKNPLR